MQIGLLSTLFLLFLIEIFFFIISSQHNVLQLLTPYLGVSIVGAKLRGTGQLQPHPPICFKNVEIFIPLEVYTYVVTASSILLATSTQLIDT